MDWDLNEAIAYYRGLGAPAEQSALMGLLREIQDHRGGIPRQDLALAAASYGVKEGLLLAHIRRVPSLHLLERPCLELCAGPNCGRAKALAALAEELHRAAPASFELRRVPCQRMCGQGPNLRWNGRLYTHANEALLRRLLKENKR